MGISFGGPSTVSDAAPGDAIGGVAATGMEEEGDGCDEAGGLVELYFTGDSLFKKSRRLGSRLRRGSCFFPSSSSDDPQNQPIISNSTVLYTVAVLKIVTIVHGEVPMGIR